MAHPLDNVLFSMLLHVWTCKLEVLGFVEKGPFFSRIPSKTRFPDI